MRKKKENDINQISSFIGKGVHFEGNLRFNGSVKIDGFFKGEIRAPEGHLIVGDSSTIEADIDVASILCSGEIHGKMTAHKRITVRVPGKVFGDIQAPTIVIEEGVCLEGTCKTTATPAKSTDKDKVPASTIKPFPSEKKPSQGDVSTGKIGN